MEPTRFDRKWAEQDEGDPSTDWHYAVTMSNVFRQKLWVRNSASSPLQLSVEPWANEILMEPGKSYAATRPETPDWP